MTLRDQLDDATKVIDMMTDILTRTANALKGDPPDRVWHDWSDLPEVAKRLKSELEASKALWLQDHVADVVVTSDGWVYNK